MVINLLCLLIGIGLISFGLYLKRRSMAKNPRYRIDDFVVWSLVDIFFWLCLSTLLVIGGLSLLYLLTSYL